MADMNLIKIETGDKYEQFLFAAIDDTTGNCVDYSYETGDLEEIWDRLYADGDHWNREWHLIGTGCSIVGNIDRIHASLVAPDRFTGHDTLFINEDN